MEAATVNVPDAPELPAAPARGPFAPVAAEPEANAAREGDGEAEPSSRDGEVLPGDELGLEQRRAAEAVLTTFCGNCHGAAAIANDNVRGGIDYIEDLDELVERNWIKPLDSRNSPPVQLLRDGSMPPADVEPRPSREDIRPLETFIDLPRFW